jgi:hypothetical protein
MSMRTLFVGLISASLICGLGPRPRTAVAVAGGFGVMGDSGSDEYRADDNRGGAAHRTLNWVELLVRYRGWMPADGATGESRRPGYESSWAMSGAPRRGRDSGRQAAGWRSGSRVGRLSELCC